MAARSRKPHPADIAHANIVMNAVRFEIALFLGVGRYAADSAETLVEARSKAARLAPMHPNGRRPLIYAVTAEGRSDLVTEACLSNAEKDAMKTYAKKFNAQRAAKAAGHSLDEVEIVKTRDGFSYRLKGAAAGDQEPSAEKKQRTTARTRALGERAAIEEAAHKGKLPAPPDFSAPTHKRFRNKLATVVELAKAGDLDGLRAFEINPVSSSPKAIARYRDLCIVALEARGA